MHLLVYYLKKDVANDVINVSFFCLRQFTLKLKILTKEDIDKKCLGIKKVRSETIN